MFLLSPDLYIGVTIDFLKQLGTFPILKIRFIIYAKGLAIS